MSVNIIKPHHIDPSNITFSNIISKKQQQLITRDGNTFDKTIHYIDILYKGRPLYIQINDCKIVEFNDKINNAKIKIDDKLFKIIRTLEEFMIQQVHKQSHKLFNGKSFTINKIRSSFISNINEHTKESVLTTTLEREGLIFDQYKQKINISDVIKNINKTGEIDGIFILKLANLQFMDNYFTYNFVLEQSKIYIHNYLDAYSIIDTSSSISSRASNSKLQTPSHKLVQSSSDSKYDGADYNEYHCSE